MAFQTKKSRMATVKETTEGTPVTPGAGSDYLAIQEGFELNLEKEELENAELRASIGSAQSLSGFETPNASISHYVRHSGTEGQAPQDGYANLFEAGYGEENVAPGEITAAAGSTVSIVKVADSSTFKIGEALLVKHAANDYEIRVIKAIPNGTDLELLFDLNNAPATGTALGIAVHYNAVDSDHPTLSVWDYRANGGTVQMMAGARVVSTEITAEAGQLLNASFSLEGISGYYMPLEITAPSDSLDFTDDAGAQSLTLDVGHFKSPIAAAEALEAAFNDASSQTVTVTYSNSTGLFTWTATGTTFDIDWATTTDTLGAVFGFTADDSGGLTGTSDSALTLTSPQTPAFDSPGTPLVVKHNELFLGNQSDNMCLSTISFTYTLETPKTDEKDLCAETAKSGSIINERVVTVDIEANLTQYDAQKFDAFCKNTGLSWEYNFGTRTGQNWDAGKSGTLHMKDCQVVAHNISDDDGLVSVSLSLRGFVDSSGNSETGLNFL